MLCFDSAGLQLAALAVVQHRFKSLEQKSHLQKRRKFPGFEKGPLDFSELTIYFIAISFSAIRLVCRMA